MGGWWEALRGWPAGERSQIVLRASAQTKPKRSQSKPTDLPLVPRFWAGNGVGGGTKPNGEFQNEANGGQLAVGGGQSHWAIVGGTGVSPVISPQRKVRFRPGPAGQRQPR